MLKKSLLITAVSGIVWLALALTQSINAQTVLSAPPQFDTTGYSVGATGPGQTVSAMILADLDNDGDADVVSGDRLGKIIAWRNDGSPFGNGWY